MRFLNVVALSLFVFAPGLAAADAASAEAEVSAAIHARIEAFNRRDLRAFRAAAAEPYLGVGDDGLTQEAVPDYSHLARNDDQIRDIRDLHVRVHGDTAVANYRTTEHEPMGGIDLVSEERRSEAWQKQRGTWRLLQAHLMVIPVNRREPIAGLPGRLSDYPGVYTMRADIVLTVTVSGNRLFMAYMGETEPWEASYGGGDTFFFRQLAGDLTSYEFERDAQGRVTALLARRADGQTLRAPRR
jgi:ketosteroid isomerase-like protein